MAIVSVHAGKLLELPPGAMAGFSAGYRTFTLCNVDGVVYAIDGNCPHRGAPLAQGALHGHTIVCPWHAWEFDCRTGTGDCGDVRTYSVHVENGSIYVHA